MERTATRREIQFAMTKPLISHFPLGFGSGRSSLSRYMVTEVNVSFYINNKTRKGNTMQVVIRKYTGKDAAALIDLLEKRATEVQSLMRSVKGLVSYKVARSQGGGFTVTVCDDRAGIDESIQKAKDWIAKNAAHLGAVAPEVSIGDVIVQVN
jgi:hypothetical protein